MNLLQPSTSQAIVRPHSQNEFSVATCSAVLSAVRCSMGLIPVANNFRASARCSLAKTRGTSGYLPNVMSFAFPSYRKVHRQSFPPAG
jgi:hypothetical protein